MKKPILNYLCAKCPPTKIYLFIFSDDDDHHSNFNEAYAGHLVIEKTFDPVTDLQLILNKCSNIKYNDSVV